MPPTHHPLTTRQQLPSSPDAPQPNTPTFPILALGIAFAAFFLACLGICCCSYYRRRRNTSARNRNRTAANYTQLRTIPPPRTWPRSSSTASTPAASGLGLKHLHEPSPAAIAPGPEEQLPAYEESERSSTPAFLLTPVPDLVTPSPALSVYSDQNDDESRRLLGSNFRSWAVTPPPTPPAPTYAGPALG